MFFMFVLLAWKKRESVKRERERKKKRERKKNVESEKNVKEAGRKKSPPPLSLFLFLSLSLGFHRLLQLVSHDRRMMKNVVPHSTPPQLPNSPKKDDNCGANSFYFCILIFKKKLGINFFIFIDRNSARLSRALVSNCSKRWQSSW